MITFPKCNKTRFMPLFSPKMKLAINPPKNTAQPEMSWNGWKPLKKIDDMTARIIVSQLFPVAH
ncbi:MAG: hypothetical protein COU63_01025 [Candidatus Pacebacteria bacterium CG10_big_fil_rev_8_21_14_0_10_36_11]|nr:MAG: hypothetical protein AUK08_00625 [Candidatus Pacebacteria bacterium CG2_30_36_39]PIR65228.1 MAG: hypothetical protein COU63_01025 [Candidatus Pacebacteria bacterium CG10_big_fil_rev_8_21_14_0_10_36_11]